MAILVFVDDHAQHIRFDGLDMAEQVQEDYEAHGSVADLVFLP